MLIKRYETKYISYFRVPHLAKIQYGHNQEFTVRAPLKKLITITCFNYKTIATFVYHVNILPFYPMAPNYYCKKWYNIAKNILITSFCPNVEQHVVRNEKLTGLT